MSILKQSISKPDQERVSQVFKEVSTLQMEITHITRGITDAEIAARVKEYKAECRRRKKKAENEPTNFLDTIKKMAGF